MGVSAKHRKHMKSSSTSHTCNLPENEHFPDSRHPKPNAHLKKMPSWKACWSDPYISHLRLVSPRIRWFIPQPSESHGPLAQIHQTFVPVFVSNVQFSPCHLLDQLARTYGRRVTGLRLEPGPFPAKHRAVNPIAGYQKLNVPQVGDGCPKLGMAGRGEEWLKRSQLLSRLGGDWDLSSVPETELVATESQ